MEQYPCSCGCQGFPPTTRQEQTNSTTDNGVHSQADTEGDQESKTNHRDNDNIEDPFTIIFISDDLETKYRGHGIGRSQFVVNYVRDLKYSDLHFDGDYSQYKINPRLVIHGGDLSHMWACGNFEWFFIGGCRNDEDEFKDVWDRLYEADIPMISAFGNHDWNARTGTGNPWGDGPEGDLPRDDEADYINQWSQRFTRPSYEKSAKLTRAGYSTKKWSHLELLDNPCTERPFGASRWLISIRPSTGSPKMITVFIAPTTNSIDCPRPWIGA